MPIGSIALCRQALVRLGATPISSFQEASAEAEIAAELYGPARDELLGGYYWNFARAQRELNQATGEPVADFTYAYLLPADFMRAERFGNRRDGSDRWPYQIVEQRLHTDAGQPAILTYTFRPDESTWPHFFDAALIRRLAADFAVPLTEDTRKADYWEQQAEIALRRARLADSQQDTPGSLHHFPLTDVRG